MKIKKSKFKVGDIFRSKFGRWEGFMYPSVIKDRFYEILEVVPAHCRPKIFCNESFTVTQPVMSYVLSQISCQWTFHELEHSLENREFWKPVKKEWESYPINRRQMATAIFEYLEKRGKKVDRKRGIRDATTIGGFRTGGYFVTVKKLPE